MVSNKREIICLSCGKKVKTFGFIYCSNKCQRDYAYQNYIERWLRGEETGSHSKNSESQASPIRRYLFEKYDGKCQKCGWGTINPFTNKVPLAIHHIDGNPSNNTPWNLELLCPNCHSLTHNFGSRNKGNGRKNRKK